MKIVWTVLIFWPKIIVRNYKRNKFYIRKSDKKLANNYWLNNKKYVMLIRKFNLKITLWWHTFQRNPVSHNNINMISINDREKRGSRNVLRKFLQEINFRGWKWKKGWGKRDSPRRYSARHQRQLRRSLRWLQLQLRCVCKGNIPRDVARRPRALLAAGRGHVFPTSEASLPVSPTRSPATEPCLLLC